MLFDGHVDMHVGHSRHEIRAGVYPSNAALGEFDFTRRTNTDDAITIDNHRDVFDDGRRRHRDGGYIDERDARASIEAELAFKRFDQFRRQRLSRYNRGPRPAFRTRVVEDLLRRRWPRL